MIPYHLCGSDDVSQNGRRNLEKFRCTSIINESTLNAKQRNSDLRNECDTYLNQRFI